MATVATIAAIISYRHTLELVRHYGETGTIAKALPITVDGLIATCSLVLLDCARRGRRPPWHAWALLAAGIAATLGANIAHGADHGPIGALVAGWPALVAVGSFELATRLLRTGSDVPLRASATERSTRQQKTSAPLDNRSPSVGRAIAPEVAAARERFADLLANGRVPSLRALKQELRIGHSKATCIHAVLVEQGRSREGEGAGESVGPT